MRVKTSLMKHRGALCQADERPPHQQWHECTAGVLHVKWGYGFTNHLVYLTVSTLKMSVWHTHNEQLLTL